MQTRSYDIKGQLVSLRDVDAQDEPIAHYDYRYDAAGNMVREGKLPANQVPQINLDMDYGLANQLTQVQQMPTVFDEDGNLQQAAR